jgi:hypothetical protein
VPLSRTYFEDGTGRAYYEVDNGTVIFINYQEMGPINKQMANDWAAHSDGINFLNYSLP